MVEMGSEQYMDVRAPSTMSQRESRIYFGKVVRSWPDEPKMFVGSPKKYVVQILENGVRRNDIYEKPGASIW